MLSKEIINNIKFISDHYGYLQYGQTIEECSELILAIRKYQRMMESSNINKNECLKLKNHIIEEMSDVFCMIEQLKNIVPVKDDEIEKEIELKVKRQLKRIEEEKDN